VIEAQPGATGVPTRREWRRDAVRTEQIERLKVLILQYRKVFALCDADMALTNKFKAKVQLKDHEEPVTARPCTMAMSLRERFDELLSGKEVS
jgi:hypothetical protein